MIVQWLEFTIAQLHSLGGAHPSLRLGDLALAAIDLLGLQLDCVKYQDAEHLNTVLLDLEPGADLWAPRELLDGRIAEFGGLVVAGLGPHFAIVDGNWQQGMLESQETVQHFDRIG